MNWTYGPICMWSQKKKNIYKEIYIMLTCWAGRLRLTLWLFFSVCKHNPPLQENIKGKFIQISSELKNWPIDISRTIPASLSLWNDISSNVNGQAGFVGVSASTTPCLLLATYWLLGNIFFQKKNISYVVLPPPLNVIKVIWFCARWTLISLTGLYENVTTFLTLKSIL